MAEGQEASVPIQSLLMQIDAGRVCLVRTPFQQLSLWRYLLLAADSRRICVAGLSSRILWNVGCRTLPSGVHSTKLISATAVGFTHRSLPLARLLQRPLVDA